MTDDRLELLSKYLKYLLKDEILFTISASRLNLSKSLVKHLSYENKSIIKFYVPFAVAQL